jgi:hypothetical protein
MSRKCAVCVAWPVAVVATTFFFAGSPSAFAQGQRSSASDGVKTRPSPAISAAESYGLPQDVLQVIHWLPEDTESIMLTRGPLQKDFLKDFGDPSPMVLSPTAGGFQSPAADTSRFDS